MTRLLVITTMFILFIRAGGEGSYRIVESGGGERYSTDGRETNQPEQSEIAVVKSKHEEVELCPEDAALDNLTRSVLGMLNNSRNDDAQRKTRENVLFDVSGFVDQLYSARTPDVLNEPENCSAMIKGDLMSLNKTLHNQLTAINSSVRTIKNVMEATSAADEPAHQKIVDDVAAANSDMEPRLMKQMDEFQEEMNGAIYNIMKLLLNKKVDEGYTKKDCMELYNEGRAMDGAYGIKPDGKIAVSVICENGWTIILRKEIGDVSFNKTLLQFVDGFGHARTDYMMGLRYIHSLTNNAPITYISRFEFIPQDETEVRWVQPYPFILAYNEVNKYSLRRLQISSGSVSTSDRGKIGRGLKDTTFLEDDGTGKYCSGSKGHGWGKSMRRGGPNCAHRNGLTMALVLHRNNNNDVACANDNPVCVSIMDTLVRSFRIKIKPWTPPT